MVKCSVFDYLSQNLTQKRAICAKWVSIAACIIVIKIVDLKKRLSKLRNQEKKVHVAQNVRINAFEPVVGQQKRCSRSE